MNIKVQRNEHDWQSNQKKMKRNFLELSPTTSILFLWYNDLNTKNIYSIIDFNAIKSIHYPINKTTSIYSIININIDADVLSFNNKLSIIIDNSIYKFNFNCEEIESHFHSISMNTDLIHADVGSHSHFIIINTDINDLDIESHFHFIMMNIDDDFNDDNKSWNLISYIHLTFRLIT